MSAVTILASRTETASGTAAVSLTGLDLVCAASLLLSVTAAAADAGDTLDVYLQHSMDGGTTWDDFIHWTQVLGNGGAKKHLASWVRDVTPTTAMKATADGALAAGVQQGPVGGEWRVKWTIVDSGDADQSFTFSIAGEVLYGR